MAYTNGNLALQPKRKPEQLPSYREKKTKVTKRKPLPTRDKLIILMTIVLVFSTLAFINYRYNQIYSMNYQAKEASKALGKLEVEIGELRKVVETESSPEKIAEKAKGLGMIPSPGNDIIVDNSATGTKE